jgi:hypothetical protein
MSCATASMKNTSMMIRTAMCVMLHKKILAVFISNSNNERRKIIPLIGIPIALIHKINPPILSKKLSLSQSSGPVDKPICIERAPKNAMNVRTIQNW